VTCGRGSLLSRSMLVLVTQLALLKKEKRKVEINGQLFLDEKRGVC